MKKIFLLLTYFLTCSAGAESLTVTCPETIETVQSSTYSDEKLKMFNVNARKGLSKFLSINIGTKSDDNLPFSGLIYDVSFLHEDEQHEEIKGSIHAHRYWLSPAEPVEQAYIFCAYKDTSVYLSFPIPKKYQVCKIYSEEKSGNIKDIKAVCDETDQYIK